MPLLNWDGRGYRNGFTSLTAGTSHLDFYWKRYEGQEGGWNQADDPSYKIEDLVNYSVWLPSVPAGGGDANWSTPARCWKSPSARASSSSTSFAGKRPARRWRPSRRASSRR